MLLPESMFTSEEYYNIFFPELYDFITCFFSHFYVPINMLISGTEGLITLSIPSSSNSKLSINIRPCNSPSPQGKEKELVKTAQEAQREDGA